MTSATCGEWIKQRRKSLDLTQRALAEQAACTPETIRKLEADRLRPSRRLAERLATALSLPPDASDVFVQFARGHLAEIPRGLRDLPSSPTPLDQPFWSPNVPTPLTPLVGRSAEVDAVATLLQDDSVHLVTVVGPPGVGKTRLAIQCAADVGARFADGVCWVDLTPVADPAQVLVTIARALNIRAAGSQSSDEAVIRTLRDRHLLLLLDNFEHVRAAAPAIALLLTHAPRLKALATSRVVLNLSGEHTFVVPPLALPDMRQPISADTLAATAACVLFLQRMQASQSDVPLDDANAQSIAAICHLLDGLPLAIELAASRVTLFPPQVLVQHLHQRYELLNKGAVDAPPHQQTLHGAITWSYDLLDAPQQALFRRLGVFVGGCTMNAAQRICGDPDVVRSVGDQALQMNDLVDSLTALIDHSLVQRVVDSAGEPRFIMLETLRAYALERLAEAGEAEAVRQRHAAYFLVVAEAAEPQLDQGEQKAWLDRVATDFENFRAALAWSQTPAGDRVLGLRLAIALVGFWTVRGYYSEGRAWLSSTARDQHTGDTDLRSLATACGARLAWQQGDYGQAQADAEASLRVARHHNHHRARAIALSTLGMVAARHGDLTQANSLLEEALARWRTLSHAKEIASTLSHLGNIAHMRNDLERANALYTENLRLCSQQNNKRCMIWSLAGLGNIAMDQDDLPRARALYQESYTIACELEHKVYIATALMGLGEVERLAEHQTQAIDAYQESLAQFRELGAKADVALVLHSLGHVQLRAGQGARAASSFLESLNLSQELGRKPLIAGCLTGLAGVAGAMGRGDRAIRLLSVAAALLQRLNHGLDKPDQRDYDRYLAAARSQLDPTRFTDAWAAGHALTMEQAVAEARDAAALAQTRGASASSTRSATASAELTARELEVLRLVAQGLTNAQVAVGLSISIRTVHAHLQGIYGKIGVSSRSAATRFALEHDLA